MTVNQLAQAILVNTVLVASGYMACHRAGFCGMLHDKFLHGLAPDRPDLHFKSGEVTRHMKGEATGPLEHAPGLTLPIEAEIAVAGVVGQFAWRHRQRLECHAGQLYTDEVTDTLDA